MHDLFLAKEIYSLVGSKGAESKTIPVSLSASGLWGPLPKDSWLLNHYLQNFPVGNRSG